MQELEAEAQIAILSARVRSQNVALAQERSDVAGQRTVARLPRAQHHVSEARVEPECGHRTAVRGQPSFSVDRVEVTQQSASLSVCRGGRRIEPGERGRV